MTNFYKKILKPLFDRSIALVGIIILSPIFIIVVLLLLFFQNGNVFFKQFRPGLKGKIFRLIKFKTMNDKTDSNGELLPDELRLTKIGKMIRKSSLDELPQLFNVLKGNMSIIGPRPLLVEYLTLYNTEQARRHDVKPGITGWAQINGRNAISWNEKFKYDVWYVDNLSFKLDLKILFLTIKKVFTREGVFSENMVTMKKFTNN